MNTTNAVLLGAGQRGRDAFGGFAKRHPEELRFVAVADPNESFRARFAAEHKIPADRQFKSWEELLAQPQLAPTCINATMDHVHHDSAIAAMEKGYHVLLEKPIAPTPGECRQIAKTAERTNRILQICHPLRFTPLYLEIKRLLESRAIGRLLSLTMQESVAFWHFAHSYVRGNWRRSDISGPLILTKCCHDMDVAVWLMNSNVSRVSSYGSLSHFRSEYAPDDAPKRCIEGCPVEETCPYHAPTLYLGSMIEWPVSVISPDSSPDARRSALKTGPYGRCVYHCDNNVVDHQVIAAEFKNSATFDFAVRAHTNDCYRTLRAIGSEGELNAHFEKNETSVTRFRQGMSEPRCDEIYRPANLDGAHGGGDTGVIRQFLRLIKENDMTSMKRSLDISLEGHLLAFAAEQARTSGTVIRMGQ